MSELKELDVIDILKQYFKANKIEIYKRKLIAPLSYEVIYIVVVDKKTDLQTALNNFLLTNYSLQKHITFDSSEALIDNNRIEVDYLFFKARIDLKGQQ
jgi:hypothetical protein